MIRLFADFQNSSAAGHVRLSTVGTLRDVEKLGLEFHEGMAVVLDDADSHVADATVLWEVGEGWVAKIDWERLKNKMGESDESGHAH